MCCQTPPEHLCSGHGQCCPQPWPGKFLSAVVSREDEDLELVKVLRKRINHSALNGTSILIPLPTGNLRRGGGENVETRGWIGVLWHTVFRTYMPTAPTDSFQLYSPAREQVNEIRWPLTGSINRLSGLSTKKEKQRKRERKGKERKGHEREAGHVEVI